jgi:membrane fusion protein
MSELFREEVYQAQKNSIEGELLLTQPLKLYVIGILLLTFFVISLTLLSLGSYNAKENAIGSIVSKNPDVIQSSSYIARLYVSTKAIGFIRPGQLIKLRYHAFAYQKFGVQQGTVSYVSPTTTTLVPGEAPVYMIEATLAKQTVSAYGKEMPLLSDMTLDAQIIIGQRSLLQWLFDPVHAQGKQ